LLLAAVRVAAVLVAAVLVAAVLAGSAAAIGPASAGSADCRRDQTSSCAKPALAQTTQRATLALAQSQINHNSCPYLPANANAERMYSIHDVAFSQRLN
jgi:hypothetical protein